MGTLPLWKTCFSMPTSIWFFGFLTCGKTDFNIMGTAFGTHGIEEDSNKAIFTNVNLELVSCQVNNIG